MFTPRTLADGSTNAQAYGLGWRTARVQFDALPGTTTTIVHHGGTAIGGESMLLLVPEYEIVVALVGNAYTGGSGGLLRAAVSIAGEFLPAVDAVPERLAP
jgi:serine beta-lactamase-like protein LACTB, mitochondrial